MRTPRHTATLTDRGYGIGMHSFNGTVLRDGKFVTVRQVVVSDVFGFGDNTLVYDLDARTVTMLDRDRTVVTAPRWTWAQVEEVVARDLAEIGKGFGDKYGAFEESTLYGLYGGKRPSWMPADVWETRKAMAGTI